MARLCKKEELYDYRCGDYLLWRENRKRETWPCTVYSPAQELYIFSPHPEYFYVNGWEKIETYNKEWRVWERRPTIEESLKEAWDNE